jgi:hypothetical protein
MSNPQLQTEVEGSQLPARQLVRGVQAHFREMGFTCITEFSLPNARRADVAALGRMGELVLVEIKSCLQDFRTDQKWPHYVPFCDQFFFAVGTDFPRDVLPRDQGLILADKYGAQILRPALVQKLHANRRRALTLRFARAAASRLVADRLA